MHQVLIGDGWKESQSSGSFSATNPATKEPLEDQYPISTWQECQAALEHATSAFWELKRMSPDKISAFLEAFAFGIERQSDQIRQMAALETGLPFDTRLQGELDRTTNQLREAAQAARDGNWCLPTIDADNNIRSCYASLGPVLVFAPNNFPLAFGCISGGDFAAAIAAGNPVIAKSNPMHPGTTRLLAIQAFQAAQETGMPAGTVQMIYEMNHEDGFKLSQEPALGAIAYTGSRKAGLKLKQAADAVGKPIYLELSSINPVLVLPGAITSRGEEIASELTSSCLMAAGQFCTNPGLIIVESSESTESFIATVAQQFSAAPVGTLFSESGEKGLADSVDVLKTAGATVVCGDDGQRSNGFSFPNTVLRATGAQFLSQPEKLQTEAFGNVTLFVVSEGLTQTKQIIEQLEGSLVGTIYSDVGGTDDSTYDELAPILRQRVGRLTNDKMPTGVAVSPAMNHGGPYPSTGHPGFTAVGLPASMRRFAMLQCFDNVRPARLPSILRDGD